MLDSHTINRTPARDLAIDFQRVLAGPAREAALSVRAAAEGGVVQAQLVYGQWLLDGHGVQADPQQAIQWFRHAARHGEPMALNMLGQCHAHGWGVPRNLLMAAYWYRLAALGGLDWGMYNYATALTLGQGTEQDRPAALTWFRKAAALGHAKSLNMVGSFHEDGWGGAARDEDAALAFYLKAAQGGDFRGQFNAARLLVTRSHLPEAIHWLQQVPESATPSFLNKAAAWLRAQGPQALQDIADRYESINAEAETNSAPHPAD